MSTPCRTVDPEVFFPRPSDAAGIAKAIALCGRCPIKAQCLEAAVDNGEEHGVWGGRMMSKAAPLVTEKPMVPVILGDDGWPIGVPRERFKNTHCRAGHEFTQLNTKWRWHRTYATTLRDCRKCRDARKTKHRETAPEALLLVS